ncbi:molecular chaperone DnaK [Agromyces badenianii]|uniref:Molecular chaperone DnaK n=1 Tax=Agromyces badenianii TaxID=2080742 RepID=A0A2S0WVA0_9MICO|nr:Hsp70 family protein [Agromyces badenianii]AWB95231.1 molecular chaperone DnaK [Agromyces badenianii]
MGTSFVLGIDVGTTFTAAAIGRRRPDGSVEVEPLELGSRRTAVPTVVFLGEDGGVLVGEAAERRAIEQPDRVVREFKRRVGDQTPIIVGDLRVAPEDIFAVLAEWVVERARQHEGAEPAAIAVSHPAAWGDHRLQLIRTALAGVGLGDIELVSEPEAAGLHYLDREKLADGQAVAVYDLGGGTFDVALLRMHGDDFRLIGVPTGIEHLGGADFDQRIFEHVKSLAGEAILGIDEARPDDALALARIRRDCTEAKEALSFDAETVVPVLMPAAHARVRIVRSEFEQMIDADLRRTFESLRSAVADAGLEPDDLSTVLLIGGSSRIPAVAELISCELGLPVAVDADPKASISLGAAVAASRRLAPLPAPAAVPDDASGSADSTASGALPAPGAPIAAAAELRAPRMSVGLRATILAGVAAAIIAVVIPITPLTVGTLEQPEGEPTGSSSARPNAAAAGGYVAGAAPLVQAVTDPVFQKDAAEPGQGTPEADASPPSYRPLSPANDGTGAATPPSSATDPGAPGPAPDSPPQQAADPPADPAPDPAPNPDPAPAPAPDPAPDPAPQPVPDPTPEPEPVSDPPPEPDPVTDPAPDPAPDPTEPPPPAP